LTRLSHHCLPGQRRAFVARPSDVHAFQDGASMAALPIQLSLDDMKTIAEMVADLIERPKKQEKSRHGVTPAAIPAYEAARYLGMSRARWYELLLVDQELAAASITIGNKRLWPIDVS
jgi:hypothetical protein